MGQACVGDAAGLREWVPESKSQGPSSPSPRCRRCVSPWSERSPASVTLVLPRWRPQIRSPYRSTRRARSSSWKSTSWPKEGAGKSIEKQLLAADRSDQPGRPLDHSRVASQPLEVVDQMLPAQGQLPVGRGAQHVVSRDSAAGPSFLTTDGSSWENTTRSKNGQPTPSRIFRRRRERRRRLTPSLEGSVAIAGSCGFTLMSRIAGKERGSGFSSRTYSSESRLESLTYIRGYHFWGINPGRPIARRRPKSGGDA